MRPTPARLCLIVGVLAGASASGAEPARVESAWPFFYRMESPGRTEWEVLGPLGFYRKGPEAATYGLRPLFSAHDEARPRKSVWHVLYPLAYFREDPRAKRHFVFPLYYHQERVATDGRRVSVTVLFPLFWWGRSGGRPWFFVLFVGGTSRGLMGRDKVDYAGFTYIRERTGDYVIHHFLWPFFSIGRGGGRRSLRIWPFYGRAEQEGKWWNGYVLWPFFTYGQREAGHNKSAASFFSFWPLYGQSRARDGSGGSTQVLWPFFYYAWGKHKSYREWKLPFPFVVGKRTDDVQTFNLWPLYGHRRAKAGADTYFLWPLFHASKVRTKRSRYDDLKVFPLFTRVSRSDARKASHRSYWLLWPLWRSRSQEEKDERQAEANSLQLAWFANSEGFDRDYNALLGLFEHQAAPDGRRSTRLLWRLFRSERGPGWRHLQFGPLASWTRRRGLTKMSYLLGLVQTGTNHGRRGWRVFFVPFGASLCTPRNPGAEGDPSGRK